MRDRDLILLGLSTFVYALGFGLYLQLIYVYALQLGAPRFMLGVLNAVLLGFMALSNIPGAWAANRFPLRIVIVAVWWLTVPMGLCFLLASTWEWLIPGMILTGLCTACNAASKVYIMQKSRPREVAANITLIYGAMPVGMIVAPLVGGFTAERLGMRPVFALSTGLFLVSSLVVSFIRDVPHPASRRALEVRAVLRQRDFLRYVAFFLAGYVAIYMVQAFVNPYLAQVHDQSYGTLGVYAALTALGAAVLSPVSGRVADRFGSRAGVALVLAFLLASGPFLVLGPSYVLWGVAALCFGACEALRFLSYGISGRSFGDLPPAWGYGLFDTVMGAPMIGGALLGGALYADAYWLPFAVVTGICTLLLAVLGAATLARRFARVRTEA
jgi:DHA1 family multidrug resistance protein-like MFS transporter